LASEGFVRDEIGFIANKAGAEENGASRDRHG
jgi:hypothetical protein